MFAPLTPTSTRAIYLVCSPGSMWFRHSVPRCLCTCGRHLALNCGTFLSFSFFFLFSSYLKFHKFSSVFHQPSVSIKKNCRLVVFKFSKLSNHYLQKRLTEGRTFSPSMFVFFFLFILFYFIIYIREYSSITISMPCLSYTRCHLVQGYI